MSRPLRFARGPSVAFVGPGVALGGVIATGSTNLAQTNSLVWTLVAISAAGTIVTFAFLVYAIWKFRDPKVKGRRYG